MAEQQVNICLFLGDWQIHQWWSCMSRSEWAAWVQALGVLITLMIMFIQTRNEKKKLKDEINRKNSADAISMKYFLRQHRDFVTCMDYFVSSYDMQYKNYVSSKEQANGGVVVEEAIGCFMQTASHYEALVINLLKINFNEKVNLHLNAHSHFFDEIISGSNALEFIFQQYKIKGVELNKLSEGIFYFNEVEKEAYFNNLLLRHSVWMKYADASHQYFMKIINGWNGLVHATSKTRDGQM